MRSGLVSAVILLLLICGCLFLSGCSDGSGATPAGAIVGRANLYDYSPSIIQVGRTQKFWWCGQGINPAEPSHETDVILYQSIDMDTGEKVGPRIVLAETPGTWDSAYTCNPQVIQGTFTNPLGDGLTYSYALYYEATSQVAGVDNNIGVAFSNDGIQWKKYPSPVIQSTHQNLYGPAQPAVYNSDGKQAVWLFYENDEPPLSADTHLQAVSLDGVHFATLGTLTTHGLNIPPTLASWGNMAYNPDDKFWYASFNLPTRSRAMNGNTEERGSYGFQIYRIPQDDLLVGRMGWQQLNTFDTSLTGYETLFDAGFARDRYGNLYLDGSGSFPIFPSFANVSIAWNVSSSSAASQADVTTWDVGRYIWSPADPPLYQLTRYNNGTAHLVTTGWTDPHGGFFSEKKLGQMYSRPHQGADTALYGCRSGNTDYFLSLDMGCEGQRIVGINGYLYAQPVAGLTLLPLYRCSTGHDHFASNDPMCEGSRPDALLGYTLTQ